MGLVSFVVVSGIGAAITATGVGVPILGMLGFAASGPVAGTIAAAAQSYIGDVALGSIFSACQTMAMAAPTP